MPRVKCWQVDAFTDRLFGGNPAAVCLLHEDAPDEWMQAVADEMNLSETAFATPCDGGYGLRWFTPSVEVDLCGHATLATAHVLLTEKMHHQDQPIQFHTRSGVLSCSRHDDWIEMNFPATPARPIIPPEGLLESLGVSAVFVGKTEFDHLVVVERAEMVRALIPDFATMKAIATRGVIVTSRSDDSRHDFVSRFFAPAVGIDEDSVTGSAHCCLGPYWAEALGKTEMVAFQASRRGGVVGLRLNGERVILSGKAVTVWQGELR